GVLGLFFHTPIMSCNRAIPKHHFCHPVSLFAIRDNSCIRFLWDGNDFARQIYKNNKKNPIIMTIYLRLAIFHHFSCIISLGQHHNREIYPMYSP
ncbi:MAG: hypothetical protein IKJ58_10510, partial [Akkermansia sp.]|nr:hypothetical protein [Akkermansia sp.]